MQKLASRAAVFVLPVSAALSAGCSDGATPENAAPDSGSEAAAPVDSGPPADTGTGTDAGAKRDCAADVEADGLVKHLDCTGLYADAATRALAADVKPYEPALEFWSDGADKSRFLYLPPGTKIDITDFDEWSFPNGTKLWKEFKVGGKRIETRLYMKKDGGWRHTAYRWNDAETEATRKDAGETIAFSGKPPYEMPSTGQCDVCHNGRKEPVLGVDAVSLGLPGATGVTLATLAAEGRFSATPPATSITIPNDTSTKAAPALGWLHANCGACHNANPGAGAMFTSLFFLLRASQLVPDGGTPLVEDLDAYKTAVNQVSNKQNVDAGVPWVRIVPGDVAASLVADISGRRVPVGTPPDQSQMPPLVTRVVDTQGHKLLTDWIAAIP